MAPVQKKCVLFACMVASMSLPVTCTDAASEKMREERSGDHKATRGDVHDVRKDHNADSKGAASWQEKRQGDCHAICARGETEGDETRQRATRQHEGTPGHSSARNGSFEHEGVKDKWPHRRNGTWNRTSEHEDGEVEWHRSHNRTSIPHHNGTRMPHHEDSKSDETMHRQQKHSRGSHGKSKGQGKHNGRARCDCSNFSGVQSELGASRIQDMGMRGSNDGALRGTSKQERPEGRAQSGNGKGDDNSRNDGFGNAAVLGLAGAGIAALCVVLSLLCVCCRRSAKAPLKAGSVDSVVGKTIEDTMTCNPVVVTGVPVSNV